jgi:hypothetical protein
MLIEGNSGNTSGNGRGGGGPLGLFLMEVKASAPKNITIQANITQIIFIIA